MASPFGLEILGKRDPLISLLYQVKIECSLFALNAAISVICNELKALYTMRNERGI